MTEVFPAIRNSVRREAAKRGWLYLPRVAIRLASSSIAIAMALICSSCVVLPHVRIPAKEKALTARQESRAKALALYSEGVRFETADETKNAIPAFKDAIALMPGNNRIYKRLASSYIATEELGAGIETFKNLVDQHPQAYGAHRWLALLYQFNKDDERAKKHYREAIEIEPATPNPYVELAMMHHMDGETNQALDILDRAASITSDISFGNILQLAGKMYLQSIASEQTDQNLIDKHLKLLEKLDKAADDNQDILYSLAYFYSKSGNLEKAAEAYQRIISNAPRESKAYRGLSQIYLRQNRAKDALDLLNKAKERAGKPHDIMTLQADIHRKLAGKASDSETAQHHREKAIDALEEIPLTKNGDSKREFLLIQLYASNQHFKWAIETALEMEAIHPEMKKLRFFAAQTIILAARNNAEINALHLWELSKSYETNPKALSLIADILAGINSTKNACKLYDKVIGIGEIEHPRTYVKAALNARQRDIDRAFEILDKGLERFPEATSILSAAAQLNMEQNNYEKAELHFQNAYTKLQENEEKNATPIFVLQYAITLQKLDRIDKAIDLLDRPEFLELAFLQIYTELASLELEDHERDSILTVLENLQDRNPENAGLSAYIGHYYNSISDYTSATEAFKEAIAKLDSKPESEQGQLPNFYFQCGASLERQGKIDAAEEYIGKCLELDPEFAPAYNYLAYTWAVEGVKLEKAKRYVLRALKLEPDTGAYLDTLGWIEFKRGNYEKALEALERAHEIIPEDPTVLEHLGDVHAELGNEDKATEFWKRSLKIAPQNEELEQKLESQ